MSSQLVLLLGGRLTAGKDEVADHLVREHGFVKLGMSDTLAEALYRLNPWIPYLVLGFIPWITRYQKLVDKVGYVQAKKNKEVRRLLQVLGTEVGRQLLGENIWVTAAKNRIQEHLDAGRSVVITGIRYPNELSLSQAFFSGEIVTSIWVERPGIENTSQHSSEGSLSAEDFEYVLTNDKDIPGLQASADGLLEVIHHDFT